MQTKKISNAIAFQPECDIDAVRAAIAVKATGAGLLKTEHGAYNVLSIRGDASTALRTISEKVPDSHWIVRSAIGIKNNQAHAIEGKPRAGYVGYATKADVAVVQAGIDAAIGGYTNE